MSAISGLQDEISGIGTSEYIFLLFSPENSPSFLFEKITGKKMKARRKLTKWGMGD